MNNNKRYNRPFQLQVNVPRTIGILRDDWEKLSFLNKLISETFCLLGLLFEIKQWFSAYQDQVCAWFSLARL